MKEKFKELLGLLQLADIRFMESHEAVVFYPEELEKGEQAEVKTGQAFANEDPAVNNGNLLFRIKYEINFAVRGKDYFKTQYVIAVIFTTSDLEKSLELLKDEKLKEVFIRQQLNRTLWTVLRGTVLDAFNRHSLKPLPLPWLM
ncbi:MULTISPECIES: hypothetical protein [unclassified Fibrobacter]|uniref:hypothetical protein n=1 Tax=unclassified Fibrobacter TaxID=2634177 RepID=UPI000920032B|nr:MULTISPECIES: hypothetical protein [unclassified Fibrobacter]OWV03296.1 hypothetical protein B7993_13515 [Fibrobacter sp. UWH3]SHL65956.1 hypothetical protein SAMN05720765_12016 [Fibrobacter sp. UWH6]